MNIVEFFDTDAVENIVSTLLCKPERVILVGDNHKQMEKAKENYTAIAAAHGITVEFSCRKIGRNDLQDIISVLTDIVETFGPCSFDLTGGEDLYLVAVGTVFCRYRDKVQLHRFNIRNGKLFDCDADGMVQATADAALSVEENVQAYGGRVIFEEEKRGATYRWDFNDDFLADFDAMWSMCKKYAGGWNVQIHTLDLFHRGLGEADTSLSVHIDKEAEIERIRQQGHEAEFRGGFFKELEAYGLINGLRFHADTLEFTYKNEQVKRCLTNAGRVLELFVALAAREHKDKTGAPAFTDVMTGVKIDWDGKIATAAPEVDNEIDVLLMRGLVPIFISCKNGRNFTADELYKLSTVAERFGGKYAKKVLVATQLEEMKERGEAIRLRAKEMKIEIFDKFTPEHIERAFHRIS